MNTQLEDNNEKTILKVAEKLFLKHGFSGTSTTEIAKEVGKLIAKKATEGKIVSVVFDRGGFLFHGRIKAVADGAREGGLKF